MLISFLLKISSVFLFFIFFLFKADFSSFFSLDNLFLRELAFYWK